MDVCIHRFLSTVPAKHLVHLKVLVMDHRCRGGKGVYQKLYTQVAEMMYKLLDQISSLVRLSLKVDVQTMLPAVRKHGPALSSIQLLDYRDHSSPRMNVLRYEDLTPLRIKCRKLIELTIDVEFDPWFAPPRPPPFIHSALAQFRNLRRLTVYTFLDRQPPIKNMQPSVTETHDYETTDCTVRTWIDSLKAAKKGAKLRRWSSTLQSGTSMWGAIQPIALWLE